MTGNAGNHECRCGCLCNPVTQKYVDIPELTPTIVNEYIKKIEVFAPDKSSSKWVQKLKIYFNFVDDVEIPVLSEPVVAKSRPFQVLCKVNKLI